MTRHGVSVLGSRVLAVRGRSSGEWRTTPVNLLELGGRRYLVSPRGEGQWVRNLRAAGEGQLRVGRKAEAFRARELDDREKAPVLRAYLERWKVEVGIFFEGVGPKSTDEQLSAISARHPAFEVLPAALVERSVSGPSSAALEAITPGPEVYGCPGRMWV